jgi:hypothetical protein
LDIKKSNPKSKLGAAFFDLGGSNMSALFEQDKNTFAISQLPYYQTALPVFYMYLKASDKTK